VDQKNLRTVLWLSGAGRVSCSGTGLKKDSLSPLSPLLDHHYLTDIAATTIQTRFLTRRSCSTQSDVWTGRVFLSECLSVLIML
jgi:hypothetical protein